MTCEPKQLGIEKTYKKGEAMSDKYRDGKMRKDLALKIAQEAMVKAYIASDRFVERHKFSTWL